MGLRTTHIDFLGKMDQAPDEYFNYQQKNILNEEIATHKNYLVTAETFINLTPKVLPSLSDDVIKEFEKDSINYARV